MTENEERELVELEKKIDVLTMDLYGAFCCHIMPRVNTIPDCDGVYRTGPRRLIEYERRAQLDPKNIMEMIGIIIELTSLIYARKRRREQCGQ